MTDNDITAHLATKVDCGQYHRWAELPRQSVRANEYDVTECTITSVKSRWLLTAS